MSDELPECPEPSGGVHTWLMRASHWCKRHGLDPETAIALLKSKISREPTPTNEIETAVYKAYLVDHSARSPRWPNRDWHRIEQIARGGVTLQYLQDYSPDALDDFCASDFLGHLFPADGLLCLGRSLKDAAIRSRLNWQATPQLWQWQFIVPSPMCGQAGLTSGPSPHLSPRALTNVGPRKWLVIEADFSPSDIQRSGSPSSEDLCASILAELAQSRPLVAVVHSGSKSLHGWFAVNPAEDEANLIEFMKLAVTYGADPKTWSPNQFVRMAGALRDGSVIQRLVYFDARRAKQWV
jgi:hypothetical protein